MIVPQSRCYLSITLRQLASKMDSEKLALQSAFENMSVEAVELLYKTYSDAICVIDFINFLPIHHAAKLLSSPAMILLHSKYPKGIDSVSSSFTPMPPLRAALIWRGSAPAIGSIRVTKLQCRQLLSDLNPLAIKRPITGRFGILHCLLTSPAADVTDDSSFLVSLRFILRVYPESVQLPVKKNDPDRLFKSAYEYAKKNLIKNDIYIRLLLLAAPNIDNSRGRARL
jgi:hypothetical protein